MKLEDTCNFLWIWLEMKGCVVLVVWGLCQLLFGLLEAIFYHKAQDVPFKDDECHWIMNLSLGGSFNDFFAASCCFLFTCCLDREDVFEMIIQSQSFKVGYDIACMIFFLANLNCKDFLMARISNLYLMVIIHAGFGVLWTIILLISALSSLCIDNNN
jgi:hypothetical protein